jgi:hypothetical protein
MRLLSWGQLARMMRGSEEQHMNEPQTQQTRKERLAETFWARHSNPWSGWSRTLGHPALVAALYHRSWRGVAACIGYFIINPLLFPFLAQRTQSTWTAVILHLGLQWLAFASLRAAFVACRLPLLSCFFLSVSFVFFLLVINAPIGLCNELTLASLAFIFFAHNTQRA